MSVVRSDILRLYKNCLIYVNSLKYSDKEYLRDRLRREFRNEVSLDKLDYYYNKGQAFIERGKLA